MSTAAMALTVSEKESLQEYYTQTTTLQEYVMKLTDEQTDISVVSILRNLPKFREHLSSLEYTIFTDRYFKNYSIHEIVILERIRSYTEVEKVLKSIDRKFRQWMCEL